MKKWKYLWINLCVHKDTDSFFVYVKADDIYKDIVEDVETRFYTSSYDLRRPLPRPKTTFFGLRAKI